jgi:MFS family permease
MRSRLGPFLAALHPATRNLLAARFLRSVAQGALIVGFALYLARLGWSGGRIGLILGTASLGGGLLGLLVGITTDRWGRRRFLLVYEAMLAVLSLVLVFTADPTVLFGATLLGGFGRGQAGAAGPFAPAEGAWLAEAVPPRDRGMVYSVNAALGFFGMAAGALLAGAIPFLGHWLPGATAYRALFALSALGAVLVFVLMWATPGGGPVGRPPVAAPKAERRRENRALGLLVLTNAFNGVSMGLTMPLIAYWFDMKFGVGPGALGPFFMATYLLTGLAALATGLLTRRLGLVGTVLVGRGLGVALLAALPLIPSFGLAAAAYAVRSAAGRGTIGVRQALAIGLVEDGRRGWAVSLNAASMILPSTAGPVVAGYLLQGGHLALPFFLGAGLQLVYLTMYAAWFRRYDPPRW